MFVHLKGSTTTTEQRRRQTLRFDPRVPSQREYQSHRTIAAVRSLNLIAPANSLQHLWGFSADPPSAEIEIEVVTEPSLHDLAWGLVLRPTAVPAALLQQALQPNVIEFIEKETREQSSSNLWKCLHEGRITSSLFGEVFKAKQPKSLIEKILNNR